MRASGFIALLPVMLLAGCIKVDNTVTLRADGSGTVDLEYALSEQAIVQMRGVEKLRRQLADAGGETLPETAEDRLRQLFFNPDEGTFRERFKTYVPLGIELREVKVDTRKAWRQVHLRFAFSDIAKLAKADFFTAYGFSLTKLGNGNYKLLRSAAAPVAAAQNPSRSAEDDKILATLLAGFKVSIRVILPREVMTSTTGQQSRFQADWVFDFDRDPRAFAALQQQDFEIVFSGEGLDLPDVTRDAPSPDAASKAKR